MAFKFTFNFSVEHEPGELCTTDDSLSSDALSSQNIQENGRPLTYASSQSTHQGNGVSSSSPLSCKRHEVCQKSNSVSTSENFIYIKLPECRKNDSITSKLWYRNGNFRDVLSCPSTVSKSTHMLAGLIEHSDIRTGVYEGGFKIWECSIDLVQFLNLNNIDTKGKDVLELGCGGGLPGIYCLLKEANSVCFQDFNEEVIDYFTIPNLFVNIEKCDNLNFGGEEMVNFLNCKAVFLSGDWKGVDTFLKTESRQYDLILSSETIYNPKNYPVFHDLICNCLKRTGYALLANKSYYFGVGGSSKEFIEYVEMVGQLQCRIVHEITEGVNRDIIKLSWK